MSKIEVVGGRYPLPPPDTSIEELMKRTPMALQPLLGKTISARPLTGGPEQQIRVKQAWHRVGAPLQMCLRSMEHADDMIFVAKPIQAFFEIDKTVDQGDKTIVCQEFEKSVKKISSNPFPIIR